MNEDELREHRSDTEVLPSIVERCYLCDQDIADHELDDAWRGHGKGEGRIACSECYSHYVRSTVCDVCLDEYQDTGILTIAGAKNLACLSCEPEEFGPEFAVRELQEAAKHLRSLGYATGEPAYFTCSNHVWGQAVRIQEELS